MKKQINVFAMVLLAIVILEGCGSSQNMAPLKYNPTFGYTPTERKQITKNSLTVAIINPVFSNGEENNLVEPYSSFVHNMADDIEEALNVNGFTIKGSFKTRDEMVYGDKLATDFALEIEVEILFEKGDFDKRSLPLARSLICKNCYTLGGTFYHKGRVILTATDPIDGEKFWKKTIDLDRRAVVTNGNLEFYGSIGSLYDEQIMKDTGIYNPTAKVLELYYKDAIESVYKHIDPREMANISEQIKAKRKRVGQ